MSDISIPVDTLLRGVAPERFDEVINSWETYQKVDRVQLMNSKNFMLHTIFEIVQTNSFTLTQIWFMSFIEWKAVQYYGNFIQQKLLENKPLDINSLKIINEQCNFNTAINQASNLNTEGNDWPTDIPFPKENIILGEKDTQTQAAYDFAIMSCGYVILHEIGHILFKNKSPKLADIDEEKECDAYARGIMIDKVEEYSNLNSYSSDMVRAKRLFGILCAKIFILINTSKEKWKASDSHPSIRDRLTKVLPYNSETVHDDFWKMSAALLTAFATYYDLLVEPISFTSDEQLTKIIIDKF